MDTTKQLPTGSGLIDTGSYSVLLPPYSHPDKHKAVRRNGIGASDIASVLGISPWRGPWALYHDKRGVLDPTDTDVMRWGRRLEAAVAEEFADRHPEFTVGAAGIYGRLDAPHQLASPDRLLYEAPHPGDPISVLEVKTAATLDGWGEPGSEDIPVHYRAQVLWQMHVLGVTEARLALLVAGCTYREYVIGYHAEDVAVMTAAADSFWRRVQSGDEPPVDWLPATTDTLKRLYPDVTDEAVQLPPKLAIAYEQTRVHHDRISRHKALLENRIRQVLGNATRAEFAGRKVASRSVYRKRAVSVPKLRDHYPEIAEAMTVQSTVDKLTPARTQKPQHPTVRSALK